MRVAELIMSVPALYLIMALRSVFPASLSATQAYLLIVVSLSFVGWATATGSFDGDNAGSCGLFVNSGSVARDIEVSSADIVASAKAYWKPATGSSCSPCRKAPRRFSTS